jgi:predicted MFS family arabinose efflux permease
MMEELRKGLSITRRVPSVRFILTLSIPVRLTYGSFIVVEPIYVPDILHRSPTTFSLLQATFGIALVGAEVLLTRLPKRFGTTRSVAFAVISGGAAAATYIGTRVVAVAFVGVFLWGLDVAFFSTPARTLLRRGTPSSRTAGFWL